MRITVVALGTRGDVQPMLALSQGLQSAGHAVSVIAGSNFEGWIRGHGFPFTPSVDIDALMNSEKGVAWSESSSNPMQQVRAMRALVDEHGPGMATPILASAPATDLFVSSFVAEPLVQTIAEKTGLPYVNASLQPQQPSRSGAASLTPIVPQGSSLLNLWMGEFAQRLLWSVSAGATNRLRQQLGLAPHTAGRYQRARGRAPSVLGFSAHVVPPAPDWPPNIVTTGYWFLDEAASWQPSPALDAFLRAGPPPVYIGFGSMSSRAPQKTLALILEALKDARHRALIASGWSGMQAASLPEEVIVVDSVPHHWLFPRVAAVVHHGGAGTTAAGLRAGRPSMIVPHMSDQPYWGRRVHELGAGVRPVPRHRLTSKILADGLAQLVHDPGIQEKARTLGEQIRAERGVERAVDAIDTLVRSERF
jgi:sterol 3beta-glucosyltransferase